MGILRPGTGAAVPFANKNDRNVDAKANLLMQRGATDEHEQWMNARKENLFVIFLVVSARYTNVCLYVWVECVCVCVAVRVIIIK